MTKRAAKLGNIVVVIGLIGLGTVVYRYFWCVNHALSGKEWAVVHAEGTLRCDVQVDGEAKDIEVSLNDQEAKELFDIVRDAHRQIPKSEFLGWVTLRNDSGESQEIAVLAHGFKVGDQQVGADQARLDLFLEHLGKRAAAQQGK